MGERHSEYNRDGDDWYVEPDWCIEALTHRIEFVGSVHDPCCGMGTIPRTMFATGSDLVDRGYGYPARDFLSDDTVYENIVTNPPYGIGQKIIEHALNVTRRRVAALVQVKFLSSQKRHPLFHRRETEHVIMFSRRPSMPPGKLLEEHGESVRGNGSIDFCWVVWNHKHTGPTEISWAL